MCEGRIVANKMRTILCLLVVVCAVKASVMGDFMNWEVSLNSKIGRFLTSIL